MGSAPTTPIYKVRSPPTSPPARRSKGRSRARSPRSRMSTEIPRGLILLSQPVHWSISTPDMQAALPAAYRDLPCSCVELDVADLARQADRSRDWSAARRAVEEQFQSLLTPYRQSGYRIAYFGAAPIPLT